MVVSAVVRVTNIFTPASVLRRQQRKRGDWEQPVGHLDDHTKALTFARAIACARFDPKSRVQRNAAR